jgi:hypothetical protein
MIVGIQNLQYSAKPEGKGGARGVNFIWQVSDTISKTVYSNLLKPTVNVKPFINKNNKTEPETNTIEPITKFSQNKAVLKFTQKLVYQDVGGQTTLPDSTNNIPNELLLSNDSVSIYTPLLNYYAYDDGTAETGADTDQTLGKVAIKFALNKADTVNAVRFNFSPFFKDISGQFFLLQILESANGKPSKILHQQSIKVRYSTEINGFIEYPLEQNIAVKDTFFISWTKLTEDVIGIGVDKNSDFGDKIYFSLGNEWIQNKSLKGSLMVRPVMGYKINSSNPTIGPLASEEPNDKEFAVYPNPTTELLKWNFDNIKSIYIFDKSGKEIFYKEILDNQELDLKNLPESIYFLSFSDGKKNFIRKIVVVH